MKYQFYVGTYAPDGREGILKLELDTVEGKLNKIFANCDVFQPSYLCLNREKGLIYAVEERTPGGRVHTLAIEENGLKHINDLSTDGNDPCHLCLDSTGRTLYCANYTSGSLAAFALNEDGVIEKMSFFDAHEGHSVHPRRQKSAHVHFSAQHGDYLYVNDLGMDRVFIYERCPENGTLRDTKAPLVLPEGFGPRHLAFDGEERCYVLCELASKVAFFENGQLKAVYNCLPDDFAERNIDAAIRITGDLLLASNRGHDSIAVFRIAGDGTLTRTGIFKTGGKAPRDFNIFGDYVVAANQDSNLITVLKLDREKGTLSLTGIETGIYKPVCITAE